MNRRILFIGTSHIGTLLRAARSPVEHLGNFDFVAFGVPVWRLMLNQAELVVRSDALQFEPHNPSQLRGILDSVAPSFERVVGRIRSILDNPVIALDLSTVQAVVFVDCLFRFPPGLEDGFKRDGKSMVWYLDQPVTMDLLVELPGLAGGVTSFTKPFCTAGPTFQTDRSTSFLNLFQVMRSAITPDVPFFLWTFPGFREQCAAHPTGTTDLELMERLHRYALQREGLDFGYLQPPDCCLDMRTGRVRSKFLGPGFHASDAFGALAWKELISSVNARLGLMGVLHSVAD